jgi:hypothetical protein
MKQSLQVVFVFRSYYPCYAFAFSFAVQKIKIRIYKTIIFACGSVWVRNLVSDLKGGT